MVWYQWLELSMGKNWGLQWGSYMYRHPDPPRPRVLIYLYQMNSGSGCFYVHMHHPTIFLAMTHTNNVGQPHPK